MFTNIISLFCQGVKRYQHILFHICGSGLRFFLTLMTKYGIKQSLNDHINHYEIICQEFQEL